MKQKSGYVKVGVAAFLTVSAILLVYDTFFGSHAAVVLGAKFVGAIAPILYGAMIAYLLAPVINFFERSLFPKATGRARGRGKLSPVGARALSLVLTWVIICVLFYLLASVLLPELYNSITQLSANIEAYYKTISQWVSNLMERNPELKQWVGVRMDTYYADLLVWLQEQVMPKAQDVVSAVSGGIVSALIFAKNLIIGAIVSVYLLATKERCAAQGRKLVHSLFSRDHVHWVFRGIHKVDYIFSGFVRGKLLDSLIIGIICFICSTIFRFPYAPLVSVIVGVTNVIPFFGPFLGAIPSLLLILLVDPLKALYFLIFVVVLQQVDGNLIGPKILGNTTGLSSLGVIAAILVGGSFFGIPGMFFGVPVCACLYSAVSFLVSRRLRKKGMPVATAAYTHDTPEPVERPEEGEGPGK